MPLEKVIFSMDSKGFPVATVQIKDFKTNMILLIVSFNLSLHYFYEYVINIKCALYFETLLYFC